MPIEILEPGMLVRNRAAPEWGVGQVQSRLGKKVTVSFPETGKLVLDGSKVELELVNRAS